MEIIVIAIVIAVLGYGAWKYWPKADINKDGKIDAADAVEAVKKTTTRAKRVIAKNVAKSQKTEK